MPVSAITSTAVSIPFSIFSNLATDKIEDLIEKHDFLSHGMEELIVDSFLTAVKEHHKRHDKTAKKILNDMAKQIRQDKNGFLQSFVSPDRIANLNDRAYLEEVADRLAQKYDARDYQGLLFSLVIDCLDDYLRCFYANLKEKQFMSIVLTELFGFRDTQEDMLRTLSHIDQRTKWRNYQAYSGSAFYHCVELDENYRRMLAEYDEYVLSNYRLLKFVGFAPRIAGTTLAVRLEDMYVPLRMEKEARENRFRQAEGSHEEPSDAGNLLSYRRSVLLGKPGSGKSTLLRHLAVTISARRHEGGLTVPTGIPIVFKVAEYAEAYKRGKSSLHDYLCDTAEAKFRSLINTALLSASAVVLIDGLDEVTDKALRLKVIQGIESFMTAYPQCQCVVSSRIVGYNEGRLGPEFEHFHLEDLSPDQIGQFALRWMRATNPDAEEGQVAKDAEEMYEAIAANQSVMKLATNPLLMTIICMMYFTSLRLPNNRFELYEYSTETFLKSWVRLRVQSDSQLKSKDEIVEILCPIAYDIHQEKSDGRIGEDELRAKFMKYYKDIHTRADDEVVRRETREFIDFLREQAGFFYEVGTNDSGENLFSFMHLTFQEYFAGMYIAIDFFNGGQCWKKHVFDSRWTEILRLSVSHLSYHLGRVKTTEFVQGIMELPDDFPELGRKISLLCGLFVDGPLVTNDCEATSLETIVDWCATEWASIDAERILKEDCEPLLRSDVGTEFLLRCFELVKFREEQRADTGILWHVICNQYSSYVNENERALRDYVSTLDFSAVVSVLDGIFHIAHSAINTLLSRAIMALPEPPQDDTRLDFCHRLFLSCRNESEYMDLFKQLNQYEVMYPTSSEAVRSTRAALLGALIDPWSPYRRYLLRSEPNDFTPSLISFLENSMPKDDIGFAEQAIGITSRATEITENDYADFPMFVPAFFTIEKRWFVHCESDYHNTDEVNENNRKINIRIINYSMWRYWKFSFAKSDYRRIQDFLTGFPEQIRRRILSFLHSSFHGINFGDKIDDWLISQLKECDSSCGHLCFLRWDYVINHVIEDSDIDPYFVTRCSNNGFLDRSFSEPRVWNLLRQPFLYEPSAPLNALRRTASGVGNSVEQLKEVQEYIHSHSGHQRKGAWNILKRLVNTEVWSDHVEEGPRTTVHK